MTTPPPEEPSTPPSAPPPRTVIARLDPDLTDSPLRRALYDANLHPPPRTATAQPAEIAPEPDQET